jgi:thiosulfate/3-mercaptopyruvate sulfurtransferase
MERSMPDPTAESLPPFVDVSWLEANLDQVVLADVRASLDGSEGAHRHLEAHLPGAVFVDLHTVLAAPPSAAGGRHPLPDPERFAEDLGRLGIGDEVAVVAYDQGSGAWAARLVWSLRVLGQSAAVLDGGFAAWDGPTVSGPVQPMPVDRRAVPWPAERVIDTDELRRRHLDPELVVLDARDPARYAGEVTEIDARAGHVPAARSAPYAANLDAGRLRPFAELRARYDELGALHADEVVAYCGSGVTACHDLLVLEQVGVHGRLYPGSWSAWSADASLPLAVGPDPGARVHR